MVIALAGEIADYVREGGRLADMSLERARRRAARPRVRLRQPAATLGRAHRTALGEPPRRVARRPPGGRHRGLKS
jgi:hypothetical protein